MTEVWRISGEHWICLLVMMVLAWRTWRLRGEAARRTQERGSERRIREELEAYGRLDASLAQSLSAGMDRMQATRALAKRVCRTVAAQSPFTRVTMLLRNAEGRFASVGSVGTDDLTVAAVHAWAEKMVAEELAGGGGMAAEGRKASASFAIALGEWKDFDPEVDGWAMSGKRERRKHRRAVVIPIRTAMGRMAGALVVCADGVRNDGTPDALPSWGARLERAVGPLEALGARLGTALENDALTERLLRAEKLAGLGQLAGGVAHALNNPLTAVLGFAELIAETSADARVRQDAATILQEALRMKDTVQRLQEFWRPAPAVEERVDLRSIVREIEKACAARLAERGVRLQVTAAADLPALRGSADRVRQVMEHLLNNAAQAIARAPEHAGEGHAIRVRISHDDRGVRVVVSDTGTGFREPGKVFDPFYTTLEPGEGSGLGLSVCYAIVREHGGEISAYNLHPAGAAVVVELPLRKVMEPAAEEDEDGTGEEAISSDLFRPRASSRHAAGL